MKIKALELFHISIPFAHPYRLSKVYGTLIDAQAVILKLHTDEGIIGWGEADPMNPFTEETPASVMVVLRDQLAPRLLDRDPASMARIEHQLNQSILGHHMAQGAVNMALYDILGKVYEVPVHTLLGGLIHEELQLLGPVGSGTTEEDSEAIETLIEKGYRTVMIKMGALPIEDEISRMISATENFGERITLIADANQGWHFKQALQFVRGIQGYEPTILEQPIGRNNLDGLKNLRNSLPCLLSVDESLVSIDDARTLAQEQVADVFSIKVSKNGGLARSQMIARVADAFGMQCLMNSMLEFGITQAASMHLGCTLPNLVDCGHAYMSVLRMEDDITDFNRNITDAVVRMPFKPGLGIQVDEDKLEKYTRNHMMID